MAETFTKWKVTEHLRTREDACLYLQACAEEDPGDGSLIRAALNDIARAGTSEAGRTWTASSEGGGGVLQRFNEAGATRPRKGRTDQGAKRQLLSLQ